MLEEEFNGGIDLLTQSEVRLARLRAELRRAEVALRAEEERWDELYVARFGKASGPATRQTSAPIVAIGRDVSPGPALRPIAVIGREEPAPTPLRLDPGPRCPCGTCREGRDEDAGIGPGLVRPD